MRFLSLKNRPFFAFPDLWIYIKYMTIAVKYMDNLIQYIDKSEDPLLL